MKNNQWICLLLAAVLLLGTLSGCAGEAAPEDDGKLTVVATVFPLYDWAKTLLEGEGEVQMLLKNGVDLHNFQPSPADIAAIGACDLFLYVGGESDAWVEDLLASNPDRGFRTLNLLEVLGPDLLEEEVVEGMEAEEEAEGEGPELDEHVWLSLRCAKTAVAAITDALSELDAAHADAYAARCDAYLRKLTDLEAAYQAVRSAAKYDTLLVADRFPFRYLAEDLDLNYYAAFPGCAAASDVSFETVAFLAQKLRDLDLPVLLVIDGSDGEIAKTVLETAGTAAGIRTLDSCQCVTAEALAGGATYLDIMTANLAVLKEALGSDGAADV